MNPKKHETFYHQNENYSEVLKGLREDTYTKYIDILFKYGSKNSPVMDVGCGVGQVVESLSRQGLKTVGIDISRSSSECAKMKGLKVVLYDGLNIPFKDKRFGVIGSFNVLEHTDDPVNFLDEKLRVLIPEGHLIIVCPNFLSITNNYHHHTRGVLRKIKNLVLTAKKIIYSSSFSFEKMEVRTEIPFKPDHDACNVTNPMDIIHWAHDRDLKMVSWSAQGGYGKGLKSYLDVPVLRLFLGSSFLVFQKPKY